MDIAAKERAVAPSLGALADTALGFLWIAWTAEALVRLQAGPLLTLPLYALLFLRLLATMPVWTPALLQAWPMLAFPFLCILSAAWSAVPGASLTGGVQCLVTVVAGIYLGTRFGLLGLAGLIVGALGATMILSAINLAGLFQPTHAPNGGFLGIYTNKNALGQRAALLLIALALAFVLAESGRARFLWVGAILGTAILLPLSLSVTAIVVGPVAMVAFFLWSLWAGSVRARLVLLLIAAALVGALAVTVFSLSSDPLADGLAAAGKDTTLTGRTALWQTALGQFANGSLLGMGYLAYWQAPETAQTAAVLTALYGEKVSAFHNFVLEVLVALGPLGLLAMALLLGHVARALLRLPASPLRRWAVLSVGTLVFLSLLASVTMISAPQELWSIPVEVQYY
ncbi:MAG: O-antigen ligase family protein, partial [Pseudomonadota bacterium]